MRRRFVPGLVVLAGLALPVATAHALVENYFLLPGQSFIQLDPTSGFSIELGTSTPFAPFVSQLGGGASDGLRTSLSGQLRTDITPTQIGIQSGGTTVIPGNSGTWAPGAPASPGTPAPAALGVAFAFPSLDLSGTAALRGTAFSISATFPAPLVVQSPTVKTFDLVGLFSVLGGVIDFDTNLASIGGRGFLDETMQIVGFMDDGILEDLGGDVRRLTLPFRATFELGSSDLANLPIGATLALSGQIVATNRPIPEPSSVALVALGGVGLGLARRARRGGL